MKETKTKTEDARICSNVDNCSDPHGGCEHRKVHSPTRYCDVTGDYDSGAPGDECNAVSSCLVVGTIKTETVTETNKNYRVPKCERSLKAVK